MADTTPERMPADPLDAIRIDVDRNFARWGGPAETERRFKFLLALVDQQAEELDRVNKLGYHINEKWRLEQQETAALKSSLVAEIERGEALERELAEAKARVEAAIPQADIEMIAQVTTKAVYTERNRLVAALARLFPSGVARTSIPGWDITWEQCVYVDLPTGQVSWHFHDSEAYLFEGLPPYAKPWDGHSTEEKYNRLAALTTPPAGKD